MNNEINLYIAYTSWYGVKRAAKEKKERVASGRGNGTFLAYATRKIVATVVNSYYVDEVVQRMEKASWWR